MSDIYLGYKGVMVDMGIVHSPTYKGIWIDNIITAKCMCGGAVPEHYGDEIPYDSDNELARPCGIYTASEPIPCMGYGNTLVLCRLGGKTIKYQYGFRSKQAEVVGWIAGQPVNNVPKLSSAFLWQEPALLSVLQWLQVPIQGKFLARLVDRYGNDGSDGWWRSTNSRWAAHVYGAVRSLTYKKAEELRNKLNIEDHISRLSPTYTASYITQTDEYQQYLLAEKQAESIFLSMIKDAYAEEAEWVRTNISNVFAD